MLKDCMPRPAGEQNEQKARLKRSREELAALQMKLKENKLPVLVLVEGWGAAGKGSLIRSLIKELDPRFFQVVNMGRPTPEEQRYPFLKRYVQTIPEEGKIVFLDSGWMDEVVRQQMQSGILFNATLVRCMLENGLYEIPRFEMDFPDIEAVVGGEFLEKLQDCYARYGRDETIVITRSNKRANRYNEGIRRNVLYAEEEIESGDMLMVVKNNYYFPEHTEDCPMNFIANGDIARLKRLRRFEDFYGFRFADAVLEFPDYNDAEIECKILLDTIASESPSLTREESTRLFYEVEKDYTDIKSKLKRFKEIRENPHFNAVQVKFSYAVTCHKAQGGQWRAVFVDRCLFGDEPMSRDMLRWLYTALTRATDKLYLVNFDEKFYE